MYKEDKMSMEELAAMLSDNLMQNYWSKLWNLLEKNSFFKKDFTKFLLNPDKVIFYIGKTHWGIEYIGDTNLKEISPNWRVDLRIFDYTKEDNLLDHILGIDYSNQSGVKMPLMELNEELVHPTNEATEILIENGWNFSGQSMIIGFNMGGPVLQEGMCHRIVNGFFYGTNRSGLVTRNVKWLDLFPLEMDSTGSDVDEFSFYFWPKIDDYIYRDVKYKYPLPDGFREEKWYSLNRFVELVSSEDTKETQITNFLAKPENQFILKMAFMGKNIHAECILEWQSEGYKAIRPDFFIEGSDGYSDIVEFKLPYLKSANTIVGRENRETFSAEINSFIAQTRKYKEYFNDPRNREHAKEKYGINAHYPKGVIVMGRRWMFNDQEWRSIANDNGNVIFKSYDEIIDIVLSHLYL